MTEQDNGNLLIAKFRNFPTKKLAGQVSPTVLKYHKDWNWLMPVINQIWTDFNHSLTMNNGYAYWLDRDGEQISPDYAYGFEDIQSIWRV
jgi:hypothetical protein